MHFIVGTLGLGTIAAAVSGRFLKREDAMSQTAKR